MNGQKKATPSSKKPRKKLDIRIRIFKFPFCIFFTANQQGFTSRINALNLSNDLIEAEKNSIKRREKWRERSRKKNKRTRRKTQERQATRKPFIYQHLAEIFHPLQHLYFRPSFTSIQGGTRELCLSIFGFIFCKQELQF